MRSDVVIIRVVFTAILIIAGYVLRPLKSDPWISAALGALVAICIMLFELRIRRATLKTLLGAAVGSILGIVGAYLIGQLIMSQQSMPHEVRTFLTLALVFFMAYVGLMVGGAKGDHIELSALGGIFSDKTAKRDLKILDTSVIIDGRIADVAETGFLTGTLIIPQFILRELQQVADSPDSSKRQRGRRGLDMLNRLQNNSSLDIQIVETNDFNLNKVSQLRGVNVLNINELANALKPVVLPGEAMRVFILKEGKEHNQGVAYLDDGTMVVVDNARRLIGRNADIAVTSVLQTTAGKMIFGRLWEEAENNIPSEHRTNGGTRRPPRETRSSVVPIRLGDQSEPIIE